MVEFGRSPDLEAVARSDRLLDALAEGRPVTGGDVADQELTDLLAGWRDELRWPPATGLVAENQAIDALRRGRRADPPPRAPGRPHRGMTLVGTVAATVLGLGGFGAVISTAEPGDALYGLRSSLFGEPPSVRDEHVVLAAQTEFARVQQMIADGQWDQAHAALAEVNTSVQTVNDAARRQNLIDQWNQLNVKVENQDPEATVPPDATVDPAAPPGDPSTTVTVLTGPDAESSGTETPGSSTSTSETSDQAPEEEAEETSGQTTPGSETTTAGETPTPSASPTPTRGTAPSTTAPPGPPPGSDTVAPPTPTTSVIGEHKTPSSREVDPAERLATETDSVGEPPSSTATP
ncbi:hypothetical protein H7J77_07880 [Mycolicibacillus parakoreensis]|uniref:Anti-sigma-D factor RsdA n=1 Tax=Mycolicibacillus parakoreensis TaxID=1069221 RepID=A0ABY3U0F7_9MYCO|nr:anti-sigma-D factor RsdA [Mycolicibacillus parakoreensis]MCV7315457.1 hypothetical protein [Mycolicibacillus parakoreensis]ULN52080.1 anti-sigma-D factor RsdA [Mycolicibacillus parakoreensis]